MAKLTKEKREHLILAGLMSVMVVVGVWMLLIVPTRDAIVRSELELNAADGQLADARATVLRASQVDTETETISKFLEKMEIDMVVGDPNFWIRSKLRDFKSKRDYKVEIDPTGEPKEGDIGSLPDFPYQAMEFKLYGRAFYHDFGSFIAEFENEYPYMRLQNLDLKPDGNVGRYGPGRERLTFSVEVVVPVKPLEKKP